MWVWRSSSAGSDVPLMSRATGPRGSMCAIKTIAAAVIGTARNAPGQLQAQLKKAKAASSTTGDHRQALSL